MLDARRKRPAWMCLVLLTVAAAALAAEDSLLKHCRIVDYGADVGAGYYSRDFQRDLNVIDEDGDGDKSDDCIIYRPFSLTRYFSPDKDWYDDEATNARFYGGIVAFYANNPRGSLTEGMLNSNHELRDDFNMMTIRGRDPAERSRHYGFWFWDKKDFLNGAEKQKVTFDERSLFGPHISRYWQFLDEGRWVARDGDRFYISKATFADGPKAGDKSHKSQMCAPAHTMWARYEPKEPYGIVFDAERAQFAEHTFSDVTALGFYVARNKPAWASTALKWHSFEAYATVQRENVPSHYVDMAPVNVDAVPQFYIGTTEVTYAMWKRVWKWAVSNQYCFDLKTPGYVFAQDGDMGSMARDDQQHASDEPATNFSWLDAITWCNALSELEGRTPCYYSDEGFKEAFRKVRERDRIADYAWRPTVHTNWKADGYRLPTQAEWTAAAEREAASDQTAWTAQNASGRTQPVARLKASRLGLYDMLGNVWEYCQQEGLLLGGDYQAPGDAPPAIGVRVVRRAAGMPEPPANAVAGSIPVRYYQQTATLQADAPPVVPEGLAMVKLPAGTFQRTDEANVRISSFELGKTEVPYRAWRRVYAWGAGHGYRFDGDGDMGSMDYATDARERSPDEPVTDITWYDAVLWCNALSEMAGRTPCYYTDEQLTQVVRSGVEFRIAMWQSPDPVERSKTDLHIPIYVKWSADGFRLPTEAEWEYAYRGGLTQQYLNTPYPAGASVAADYGWLRGNSGLRTHAVGQLKPNAYGLFDMEGNVAEWCWDWPEYDYYRSRDPRGRTHDKRDELFGKCVRGSHFMGGSINAYARYSEKASAPRPQLGLRIARSQAGTLRDNDDLKPEPVLTIDESRFDPLPGKVWRGNLGRTGEFASTGPRQFGGVKWKRQTDAKVRSSPVVVGGTLYVGSDDQHVYAIDASSGGVRWKFKADGKVSSSAAAVDGVVYIGSENGTFYAISASSGEAMWSYTKRGAAITSSPAIAYNTAFVGMGTYGNGGLVGIDLATHKPVWRYRYGAGPSFSASASIAGSTIYCPTPSIDSYGADLRTEMPVFRTNIGGGQACIPISGSWLVTLEDNINGFDLTRPVSRNGKSVPTWSFRIPGGRDGLMAYHASSPAITQGRVIFGTNTSMIYALELTTGKRLWEVKAGASVDSSPAIAGNVAYIGSADGLLYAIDVTTGEVLWKHSLGAAVNSSPWLDQAVIFVGCDDGAVYALH